MNFLEHWPEDHKPPKSGGPMPFLVVLSETILGRDILVACWTTATQTFIYDLLKNVRNNIGPGNSGDLLDHCYPVLWQSKEIFGGLGQPEHC